MAWLSVIQELPSVPTVTQNQWITTYNTELPFNMVRHGNINIRSGGPSARSLILLTYIDNFCSIKDSPLIVCVETSGDITSLWTLLNDVMIVSITGGLENNPDVFKLYILCWPSMKDWPTWRLTSNPTLYPMSNICLICHHNHDPSLAFLRSTGSAVLSPLAIWGTAYSRVWSFKHLKWYCLTLALLSRTLPSNLVLSLALLSLTTGSNYRLHFITSQDFPPTSASRSLKVVVILPSQPIPTVHYETPAR